VLPREPDDEQFVSVRPQVLGLEEEFAGANHLRRVDPKVALGDLEDREAARGCARSGATRKRRDDDCHGDRERGKGEQQAATQPPS
jgi:hypothetical protein